MAKAKGLIIVYTYVLTCRCAGSKFQSVLLTNITTSETLLLEFGHFLTFNNVSQLFVILGISTRIDSVTSPGGLQNTTLKVECFFTSDTPTEVLVRDLYTTFERITNKQ